MKVGTDFTGIAVVFICHDGDGNYLFAKRGAGARDEQGRWELPAGGLKFNETVEQALLRELKEELCSVPLKIEFLGYRDLLRTIDNKPTHWLTLDFKIQVDPERVANGEPHKCDALAWFTLDAPPSPLHSATPELLHLRRPQLG